MARVGDRPAGGRHRRNGRHQGEPGRDSWKYGTAGASSSGARGVPERRAAVEVPGRLASRYPRRRQRTKRRVLRGHDRRHLPRQQPDNLVRLRRDAIARPGIISAVRTPTMSPSRSIGTAIAARRLPLRVASAPGRDLQWPSAHVTRSAGGPDGTGTHHCTQSGQHFQLTTALADPQTTMPLAPMRRDAGSSRAPSAASDDVPRSAVIEPRAHVYPAALAPPIPRAVKPAAPTPCASCSKRSPARRDGGPLAASGSPKPPEHQRHCQGHDCEDGDDRRAWPLPDVTLNLSAATNASRV